MAYCCPAHDHRYAASAYIANIAGACSTCSAPASHLLGHLLPHLLSWVNRWRILPDKPMLYNRYMQSGSVAPPLEKRLHLLEQVGTGESASIIVAALRTASVPRAHFFARPNPHGVAMLRNIC